MASPRNSEDYSDSTRIPLGLHLDSNGLDWDWDCKFAGPWLVDWSDWSPLGKVGECKDLRWTWTWGTDMGMNQWTTPQPDIVTPHGQGGLILVWTDIYFFVFSLVH